MPLEQRIIREGFKPENTEPDKILKPGQLPTRTIQRVIGLARNPNVEYYVSLFARCELNDTRGQIGFQHPTAGEFVLIDVLADEPKSLPVRLDDGTLGQIHWTLTSEKGVIYPQRGIVIVHL